jgi:hypothetical protein
MSKIPLWLKIAFTGWMIFWVPTYAGFYGLQNFLWICDLCNFILLVGLWLESRTLISSQLIGVLIVDIFWALDVAAALFLGYHPIGGTAYMFDANIPLYVRLMSLFHVFTPLVLVFAVLRVGYEKRGVILQTGITWMALAVSYLLTEPEQNINWVWGPFGEPQKAVDSWLYFLACLVAYPLLLYLPTHGIIVFICRCSCQSEKEEDQADSKSRKAVPFCSEFC